MPGSKYRLETFGKLALTGGATGSLSHQRRRLALLALLAASGSRGLSRDQLVGFFWSESAGDSGRHSLEQLLHALRRSLGDDAFTGTNPLSLNPSVISSDIADFNEFISNGDLTGAVAGYHGEFLGGFYLDEAPEFERWVSAERSRVADRYAESLNKLATAAQHAGDHDAAIHWRRRLVEAEPVSSRHALALMRAFAAAGDRTAALQHARVYEALVRQELESEPDPSVTAYAAELRAATTEQIAIISAPVVRAAKIDRLPPTHTTRAHVQTRASDPEGSTNQRDASIPQDYPATEPRPSIRETQVSLPTPRSRATTRSRYLWFAAIVIGAVLVTGYFARQRNATTAGDNNRMVVVPFRITSSDPSLQYLAEGAADLIAPMLTGEGGPQAVDSRSAISTWNRIASGHEGSADDARQVARELGAGLALSGAIVESNGRLTITGTVIPAGDGGARVLTSVTGPADSVEYLLDRFVRQLLVRESGVAETSISALTSESLPAIRAYLNGRAAYRRADEGQAIESFSRALDIDSTFALAALDLAVATGKLLRSEICRNDTCRVYAIVPGLVSRARDVDNFDRAVRLAWDNRSRLGPRDRPLLDALRGTNYPRATSARETLASLSRALSAAPDRPEIHYLIGTLLLYQGPALGLTSSQVDAEAAFRAASRLDSTYLGPLARMVDLAAFRREVPSLENAGALYLKRDSLGPTAEYVRWLVAAATNDVSAQRANRSRFRSLTPTTLDHIYLTSQMSGLNLDDADTVARILTEAATEPIDKSVAFRRAQLLSLNRGRPSDGVKFLRRMDELRSTGFTFRQFAIGSALFNDGDRLVADSSARDLARALARDTISATTPDAVRRTSVALALQALWYLDTGDTARAIAAVGWLKKQAVGQPRNRVLMVLPEMILASRQKRPEGMMLRAFVDSASLGGCCELPEFVAIELARAYDLSGDHASALRVIRRGMWFNPPRSLSRFLREEGRLSARLGDRAGAIRAYEHYLALRANPEQSMVKDRDAIRAEVRRLKRAR